MFEIHKYHEELEDTKEVINGSKSKNDRQYNGQKKTYTRTNNDLQRLAHKTKDCATRTSAKTGGKFRFSGRVSNSCSTNGSHRIYIYIYTSEN